MSDIPAYCQTANNRLQRTVLDKVPMKPEYDFSKAERGEFYRKEAKLRLPIYLDAKLQSQLERIAQKKGKEINDVVNQLVKKEVELLEELT
jgi:hypothetical protein